MEKITGWTINDFVYLTKDEKVLDDLLHKYCSEKDENLRKLCKSLGWDGGTIHQIKDEIMKRKNEIKRNALKKYQQIDSGQMKKFTHTYRL